MKLFIIGSGPSRLEYTSFIAANKNTEVWGCNQALLDKPLIPNLTTIGFGDLSAARLIMNFYKFCVNLDQTATGRCMLDVYNDLSFYCKRSTYEMYKERLPLSTQPYQLSRELSADTGNMMIAQAIDKGYTEIFCYGFDADSEHLYHNWKLASVKKGHREKYLNNRKKLFETYPEAETYVTFVG